MNLNEKLLYVQSKLNAPKSQYNSFGKYHYRNCEDIQEAVKPLLQEVGATLVIGDELIQIADRFYIKATAKFMDCKSEHMVTNTAFAREEAEKKGMDASQVTGSASSYARKYALNGLFCIDDVKDADNQDNTARGKKPSGGNSKAGAKPAPASEGGSPINTEEILAEKIDQAKLNVITGELKRTGLEGKVLLDLFGLAKLEDINNDQFVKIMKKFKVTPSKEG